MAVVGASELLAYAAAPAGASALGGALALLRVPGRRAAATAQLFTAGVIFATVAGELALAMLGLRQGTGGSCAALAAQLAASAMIGMLVFSALPAGLFAALLAFGVAALLYSVTQELLVKAHEEDEPAHVTVMFFAGFLLVLLLAALTADPRRRRCASASGPGGRRLAAGASDKPVERAPEHPPRRRAAEHGREVVSSRGGGHADECPTLGRDVDRAVDQRLGGLLAHDRVAGGGHHDQPRRRRDTRRVDRRDARRVVADRPAGIDRQDRVGDR